LNVPEAPSFFTIEDAAGADLAGIAAIYAHHVLLGLGTFEEVPPDETEMARRHAHVTALGLPYLVAKARRDVVGFAYAGLYRPRSAYRHTTEDSVYVAPSAVRRGVGRALLDSVVDRCAATGYRQMVAVIGDRDNLPSISLHRRTGFHEVGVVVDVGFKAGRWVDIVIMQRALGPGGTCPPQKIEKNGP